MYGAWNGERFHREDRLRAWGHYARHARKLSAAPQKQQTMQERLAVFTSMAGSGVGLKITKISANAPAP